MPTNETSVSEVLPLEIKYKILSYVNNLDAIGRTFGSEFTEEYTNEMLKRLSIMEDEEIHYDIETGLSCKYDGHDGWCDWDDFLEYLEEKNLVEEYFIWVKKLYDQVADHDYTGDYNPEDYPEDYHYKDDVDEHVFGEYLKYTGRYTKHGALLDHFMTEFDIKLTRRISKYYDVPSLIDLTKLSDHDPGDIFYCEKKDFDKHIEWFFECFPEEKIKKFLTKHIESIIGSIHGMTCHCKAGYGWPCSGSKNERITYFNNKMVEYGLEPHIPWYFGATEELILAYHDPSRRTKN